MDLSQGGDLVKSKFLSWMRFLGRKGHSAGNTLPGENGPLPLASLGVVNRTALVSVVPLCKVDQGGLCCSVQLSA
jgi:hypothetical protein